MNRWSLVLHIYQPPNQRADIINLVARESYNGLLDVLSDVKFPVTLNVAGSLTEQLCQSGEKETMRRLKLVRKNPHITFTTTGYTHALMPLWPAEIVVDQLQQNRQIQRQYLDPDWQAAGAWVPECAYDVKIDDPILSEGVKWIIIDESSLIGHEYQAAVRSPHSALKKVVRHRALSQALATDVEQFAVILNNLPDHKVVALDGEVFGHFDSQALDRLKEVFQRFGPQLVSANKLIRGQLPLAKLRASSWETGPNDLLRRQPFPLWQDRHNPINSAMWKLYRDVWRHISTNGSFQTDQWVKKHFTNAISSCWFWWANPKRTAGPFKMRVWNPDMIVEGLTELIKAVRSDQQMAARTKWHLETRYADLLKLVWRTHWKMR